MGDLHLKILTKFNKNFSHTCNVTELRYTRLSCYASRESEDCYYSTLKLEGSFMVPRVERLHETRNRVKKHQLLEAFISSLVQLLRPELDAIEWVIYREFTAQIKTLEKELRILLTVLGDSTLLLRDDVEHDEFQNLLAEFEAVANEAASLVHSLIFPFDQGLFFALVMDPTDPAYVKVVEVFDVVLNRIDLLKINIMEFLNLLPPTSTSASVTPKTSIMDSLLIVDSLIYDLEDLINREDNPVAGVKDQIKRLHQVLIVAQSSIKDIGSPQPSKIGELIEPLMRIGDMAHGAEYLVVSFLVGDAPLWYLINRLTDINIKFELIATELIEITKKCKYEGLAIAKYFSAQQSLQAKENTEVDDVPVGFEDNATDILDKLVGGTKHLQVISIFGMPGLGKTTLAQKLFNHPTVNYHFDRLSWCVVSQTYLRRSLLTNILIHIGSDFKKERTLKMEEEKLVEGIYKTLKGRRYLIVMDDIWDSNAWDDLRTSFPDDGNGSRVMFTTRNKDVAPPNSIIYALPSLSNEQSWELLKKKVFNDIPCPPELLGIGRKIAVNCRGLPLALVVIAGILSTMNKEKSTWEEVQENLASYIFDRGDNSSVMQILELSYKHLPEYLRPCFLYFGVFREDEEIPAGKLMRLWNAEGFIRKEAGKSAESVAEKYLMELIDKSLVMVAKRRSDGGVKACVIHDLLRDLCFKICEDENFLKFEKGNMHLTLRKHETGPQARGGSTCSSYCQHIRSFHGSCQTSILYVRNMRLLRILNSDHTFKYLIGIEHLVNLRHLVIADHLLASSIGRLVNLEYLSVQSGAHWTEVYLPPAIMKLRKLRYIHFLSLTTAKYHKDCDSSQPNNLEYLSGIDIDGLKDEEMLKCSPCLRKLKCTSSFAFDLCVLAQLESLNLDLRLGGSVAIGLPPNIKKLTLESTVSTLPWDMMSVIGRLKKLEILKLKCVGYIRDDSCEERWDTRDGEFQNLTFLELDRVNLTQWNVESGEHFPRLEGLVLIECKNLEEIPVEIGEIATLQLIEVKGRCQKSVVKSAERIQQEQQDMGNEELRVIIPATSYTHTPTPELRSPKKARTVLQKLFKTCF